MGIYAQNAAEYADSGIPVFPVDTRNKRPVVKGWQDATPRRGRLWASIDKLGAADGLGIVMGKPSGLTEIDVDAVGDAWISSALKQFGETPIVIRTASGKAKLWYRHNGEGRQIRPFHGQPIDVLGSGFTIAPPSWRDDLGTAYAFTKGSLSDVANLPTIPPDALEAHAAETVRNGKRNDTLWRWAMTQARHCDDVETLIDACATWNAAFPDPLTSSEAERCARSAWKYEAMGRNYLGLKKPQLTEGDRIMDELLMDEPLAHGLYVLLQRWHRNRQAFNLAPRAMSDAGNPAWPRRQIEHARDVLLDRGFLVELAPPSKAKRQSGLYSLSAPKRQERGCIMIVGESGKSHLEAPA